MADKKLQATKETVKKTDGQRYKHKTYHTQHTTIYQMWNTCLANSFLWMLWMSTLASTQLQPVHYSYSSYTALRGSCVDCSSISIKLRFSTLLSFCSGRNAFNSQYFFYDFGRPFVKWFALWYRTVVCLSCLFVINVDVLWPNGGWIKMKLGMEIGFGKGHIVLDGDPAPPPQRGI